MPIFNDSHPRVRYAACQCVWVFSLSLLASRLVSNLSSRGQLCTDLELRSFGRFCKKVSNRSVLLEGNYTASISSKTIRSAHTCSGRSEPKCFLYFTATLFHINLILKRVDAYVAAALINFGEGVERNTPLPYLDPIVEHLLKLLNNPAVNPSIARRYVQEQAIIMLAMVVDASEVPFGKVHRLLNLFFFFSYKSFDFRSITLLLCHCW